MFGKVHIYKLDKAIGEIKQMLIVGIGHTSVTLPIVGRDETKIKVEPR